MVLTRSNATTLGINPGKGLTNTGTPASGGGSRSARASSVSTDQSDEALPQQQQQQQDDDTIKQQQLSKAVAGTVDNGDGVDEDDDDDSAVTAASIANNICPFCGVESKDAAALERHLRKHTADKPYECEVCHKCFKAKRNMQYHQYVHHGDKGGNPDSKIVTLRKTKMEESSPTVPTTPPCLLPLHPPTSSAPPITVSPAIVTPTPTLSIGTATPTSTTTATPTTDSSSSKITPTTLKKIDGRPAATAEPVLLLTPTSTASKQDTTSPRALLPHPHPAHPHPTLPLPLSSYPLLQGAMPTLMLSTMPHLSPSASASAALSPGKHNVLPSPLHTGTSTSTGASTGTPHSEDGKKSPAALLSDMDSRNNNNKPNMDSKTATTNTATTPPRHPSGHQQLPATPGTPVTPATPSGAILPPTPPTPTMPISLAQPSPLVGGVSPGAAAAAAMLNPFYTSATMVPSAAYLWRDQYIAAYNNMNKTMPYKFHNMTPAGMMRKVGGGAASGSGRGGSSSGGKTRSSSNIIGGGNTADLDITQLLECPHCGKLCRKPCDLKRHLMMHTGEKPFKCKVCGQKFRAKGSMMYHQKAAHGIDVKLTPGLEERFLRARANQQQRKMMQISQLGSVITPVDGETPKPVDNSDQPTDLSMKQEPADPDEAIVVKIDEDLDNIMNCDDDIGEDDDSEIIIKTEALDQPDQTEVVEVDRSISVESDADSALVNSTASLATVSEEGQTKVDASSFDSGFHNESSERSISLDESKLSQAARDSVKDEIAPLDMRRTVSDSGVSTSMAAQIHNPPLDKAAVEKSMNFDSERVLVTKLEGHNTSGVDVSVFKCYLCGQMFNYLSKLQSHLLSHAEICTSNTPGYVQCPYCPENFRRDSQLSRHIRKSHKTIYSVLPESEKLDYPEEKDEEMEALEQEEERENMKMDDIERGESPVDEGLGSSTMTYEAEALRDYNDKKNIDGVKVENADDKNSESSVNMEQDIGDSSNQNEEMNDIEAKNSSLMRMKIDDDLDMTKYKHLQDVQSPISGSFLTSTPVSQGDQSSVHDRGDDGTYTCSYCSRVFHRLFSLQRHERIHTGYKPCICHICGKGFSESRNLKHHYGRFHPEYDAASQTATSTSDQSDTAKSPEPEKSQLSPTLQSAITKSRARRSLMSKKLGNRAGQRLWKATAEMIEGTQSRESFESVDPSDKQSCSSSDDLSLSSDGEDKLRLAYEQELAATLEYEKQQRALAGTSHQPEQTEADSVEDTVNEIREKESLDEDITVVIPSDSPLDHSASAALSPTDGESMDLNETQEAGEIKRPAWKSLLMNKHPRNRRPSHMDSGKDSKGMTRHASLEQESDGHEKPATMRQASVDSATLFTSQVPTSLNANMNPAISPLLSSVGYIPNLGLPGTPQLYFPQQLLASSMLPFMTTGISLTQGQLSSAAVKSSSSSSSSGTATASGLATVTTTKTDGKKGSVLRLNKSTTGGWLEDANKPDALNYTRSSSSLSRKHARRLSNPAQCPPPSNTRKDDTYKTFTLPDGSTGYRCVHCNKEFNSFDDTIRHMDLHEGTSYSDMRPYKCKFCEYYARTNSQLKVHMMRHQGIREFHCKLCNYKGVTQSDLNRHMKSQIHTMKAQNECKNCGEGFVSIKNLQRHQVTCLSGMDKMEATRDLLAARDLVAMSNSMSHRVAAAAAAGRPAAAPPSLSVATPYPTPSFIPAHILTAAAAAVAGGSHSAAGSSK